MTHEINHHSLMKGGSRIRVSSRYDGGSRDWMLCGEGAKSQAVTGHGEGLWKGSH